MNTQRPKHEIEADIAAEQERLKALHKAETASLDRLIELKSELLRAREVTHG